MATYILLMTLTSERQARAHHDPDFLLRVEREVEQAEVQTLGVYAVLGSYDFVTLVEAKDNEAIARFSIELGVKAGVHVTTLPAVPIAQLDVSNDESAGTLVEPRDLEIPQERDASYNIGTGVVPTSNA